MSLRWKMPAISRLPTALAGQVNERERARERASERDSLKLALEDAGRLSLADRACGPGVCVVERACVRVKVKVHQLSCLCFLRRQALVGSSKRFRNSFVTAVDSGLLAQ